MSTEYYARIVVGVPLNEFTTDEVDEYDLDIFQPYYDALMKDSLAGIRVFGSGSYSYSELPEKYQLDVAISIAFAKFVNLTGKVGKLYLTVDSN